MMQNERIVHPHSIYRTRLEKDYSSLGGTSFLSTLSTEEVRGDMTNLMLRNMKSTGQNCHNIRTNTSPN